MYPFHRILGNVGSGDEIVLVSKSQYCEQVIVQRVAWAPLLYFVFVRIVITKDSFSPDSQTSPVIIIRALTVPVMKRSDNVNTDTQININCNSQWFY